MGARRTTVCRNHAEQIAKILLERIFLGSRMIYRQEQSHGEWDFDLQYREGEVAAVEVTTSHNDSITQTSAQIYDRKKGGARIPANQCKSSWAIRPILGANVNKIRKSADGFLRNLECQGISRFSLTEWRVPCLPNGLEQERHKLGLEFGLVIAAQGRPEIQILGVISGRTIDPSTAIDAAMAEIAENIQKLGRATCKDRHLVVVVDSRNGGPWIAMVDFAPPQEKPKLPREITHIWLVAQMSDDQFIIWSGGSEQPWKKTDLRSCSVIN